jgi:ribosomal protein RSM22 (predicted rRNA methylase)
MQLPAELQKAIEGLAEPVSNVELRAAVHRLTQGYRQNGVPPPLRTEAERIAYLLVRMPATYAAVRRALVEVSATLEGWAPLSMLDLGAGPGTGVWAASQITPSIESVVSVEREQSLVELARRLSPTLTVDWMMSDIRNWKSARKYDLVLASYSLGELPQDVRSRVVAEAWQSCAGVFLIVEPGTQRGFDVVESLRAQLISQGAAIAAPCPHGHACPMKLAGDWCHFAARVERTAEHRRLKQGELGHEDEKFSYVAATRLTPQRAAARIVRHPQRLSGHAKLQLCAADGLRLETVTRSQKEKFRAVKRVDWGSAWD